MGHGITIEIIYLTGWKTAALHYALDCYQQWTTIPSTEWVYPEWRYFKIEPDNEYSKISFVLQNDINSPSVWDQPRQGVNYIIEYNKSDDDYRIVDRCERNEKYPIKKNHVERSISKQKSVIKEEPPVTAKSLQMQLFSVEKQIIRKCSKIVGRYSECGESASEFGNPQNVHNIVKLCDILESAGDDCSMDPNCRLDRTKVYLKPETKRFTLVNGRLSLVKVADKPMRLISDIDDTLIDSNRGIDEQKYFHELKNYIYKKKIPVVYNTGRNISDTLEVARKYSFPFPSAFVIGCGSEVFIHKSIIPSLIDLSVIVMSSFIRSISKISREIIRLFPSSFRSWDCSRSLIALHMNNIITKSIISLEGDVVEAPFNESLLVNDELIKKICKTLYDLSNERDISDFEYSPYDWVPFQQIVHLASKCIRDTVSNKMDSIEHKRRYSYPSKVDHSYSPTVPLDTIIDESSNEFEEPIKKYSCSKYTKNSNGQIAHNNRCSRPFKFQRELLHRRNNYTPKDNSSEPREPLYNRITEKSRASIVLAFLSDISIPEVTIGISLISRRFGINVLTQQERKACQKQYLKIRPCNRECTRSAKFSPLRTNVKNLVRGSSLGQLIPQEFKSSYGMSNRRYNMPAPLSRVLMNPAHTNDLSKMFEEDDEYLENNYLPSRYPSDSLNICQTGENLFSTDTLKVNEDQSPYTGFLDHISHSTKHTRQSYNFENKFAKTFNGVLPVIQSELDFLIPTSRSLPYLISNKLLMSQNHWEKYEIVTKSVYNLLRQNFTRRPEYKLVTEDEGIIIGVLSQKVYVTLLGNSKDDSRRLPIAIYTVEPCSHLDIEKLRGWITEGYDSPLKIWCIHSGGPHRHYFDILPYGTAKGKAWEKFSAIADIIFVPNVNPQKIQLRLVQGLCHEEGFLDAIAEQLSCFWADDSASLAAAYTAVSHYIGRSHCSKFCDSLDSETWQICTGDSGNDENMSIIADTFVCVGNARPELRGRISPTDPSWGFTQGFDAPIYFAYGYRAEGILEALSIINPLVCRYVSSMQYFSNIR